MKEEIQRNILRTLRDARGHPLSQAVLVLQVRARTRPFPKDSETLEGIQNLEGLGFIMSQENELEPGDPSWLLAEKGEAYVLRKHL